MRYSFQLLPHPNIHYQEALKTLAANELQWILTALGIEAEITLTDMGGSAFLCFDAPVLHEDALRHIAGHSALLLLLEQQEDGLVRVMTKPDTAYLPHDLSEVLKYKGKTSATFTRMMINCALAASSFFGSSGQLTVLDPMCGKGTTAYCALEMGMNASGVDVDSSDLAEADAYLSRYMKLHRLKHQRTPRSVTVGGRGVSQVVYTLADTREHYLAGDTRMLTLTEADTARCDAIFRKSPAELLITDLPYGIQHAPVGGRKPEPFAALLRRALPSWRQAVRPGGAAAISFNTLTLPRDELIRLVSDAGFEPINEGSCAGFRHYVEQAVTRDVLIARRP